MAPRNAPSNGHGAKARKLPKTLSAAEAHRLMEMPNLAVPTGIRDRSILELMHRCGLRVSEACGLHLRDVDWAAGEIRIRPEIAKGGREAIVYLDEQTRAGLERWKLARRPFGAGRPHLFVCVRGAQRGDPLTRRGVYKMVRRRALKAGIDRPVWPHMLRHSYATELLGEGFNIREVQKLMRHSDIRTTAIYLEVRDEQLREKIRRRAA
ncbi:MAG TPA: tyrosine-type recombinase/integrase [Solirubrobacteraceae bacterium]|jgi:integrase/recombinase XerD|nr:tyrosine-type recombinase/integrase [Solirubrobacteraceae bacterium]